MTCVRALPWGMTPGEPAAVRGRLEEFAAEVLAPLARRDQRDKGVACALRRDSAG